MLLRCLRCQPHVAIRSVATMPTTMPTASSGEDGEHDCPVCYASLSPVASTVSVAAAVSLPAASTVSCMTCKQTVCGECDRKLKGAGYVRCPLCRAPRPTKPPSLLGVIHAFQCVDPACERPQCTEAKQLLVQVEAHVQNCADCDGCRICGLWRALSRNNSLTICESPTSAMEPASITLSPPPSPLPSLTVADGLGDSASLAAVPRFADGSELRPEPAKRFRELIAHVRVCRNQRCKVCIKAREQLRVILKRRDRLAAATTAF